jgi:hypothetical protein
MVQSGGVRGQLGQARVIARSGLLGRNHHGFVESLVATGKLGADLVLLNTAFVVKKQLPGA